MSPSLKTTARSFYLIVSKLNPKMSTRYFPYEFEVVTGNVNKELIEKFSGERKGFLKVGPRKCLFPVEFKEHAKFYYNFQLRPDDIWIVSFPRSGSTLSQEMTWLLANDLNFELAAQQPIVFRFLHLELHSFIHPDIVKEVEVNLTQQENLKGIIGQLSRPGYEILAQTEGRRFIKSHMPLHLLPPNLLSMNKVIYLARNPKDVAVSYYHLSRLYKIFGYNGSFPKFWDFFEKNLVPWAPYWSHLKEAWDKRHHENFHFIFYEDLMQDYLGTAQRVAKFLNVSYTEEQFAKLAEHLKIDNLKKNQRSILLWKWWRLTRGVSIVSPEDGGLTSMKS